MPDAASEAPFYWTRFGSTPDTLPPGDELAALRAGLGRPAGEVPQMWRFYLRLNKAGDVSAELRAEHLALSLFAVHQQSQPVLMHHRSISLGQALRTVRDSDKFSSDGVDRRFGAAATASSLTELSGHLRGLISHLRVVRQPLDYTQLVADLRDWQYPDRAAKVRRRWGMAYFAPQQSPDPDPSQAPVPSPSTPTKETR